MAEEKTAPPSYSTNPVYPPQPEYPPYYPPPEYAPAQAGHPPPPCYSQAPPGYNFAPQAECLMKGQQTDQPGLATAQFVIVERPPPPDYLMLSCFVLWCCCVPIGLIAVCFSYSSSSAASKGNYEKAMSQGKTAKAASIVGLVMGVICTIIIVCVRLYILKQHHYDWP